MRRGHDIRFRTASDRRASRGLPRGGLVRPRRVASQLVLALSLVHCSVVLELSAVRADIALPGLSPAAAGSDGALSVANNTVIDLALATTGQWDQISPVAGRGVYDPDKWAVVFKYSSVTINASRTLSFTNHGSRAPVVWLVSGNVTINGSVIVSGANQMGCAGFAEPGPGGFRGGRGEGVGGQLGSAGFGPGGGDLVVGTGYAAGSYGSQGQSYQDRIPASPVYGNRMILPLIGGSGGATTHLPISSNAYCQGGGAGGGAILIAATGTITVAGSIVADGGDSDSASGSYGGGGSGGAVRLIADRVTGAGTLFARRGESYATNAYAEGAPGRIAVQTNVMQISGSGSPAYETFSPITEPILLWPDQAPTIWPTSLTAGSSPMSVPADPRARLDIPDTDLSFDTDEPVTLNIAAANVPLDWIVVVRVTPKVGDSFSVTAAPLQGTLQSSTSTAVLDLPRGIGAVQVRAHRPPSP